MLVSSHDSISMQYATNAYKETEAYLSKTAAFLISCFWNSVLKVKDYLNIQFTNIKLDKVFLHTVWNAFPGNLIYNKSQLISLRNNKLFWHYAFICRYCHENNHCIFILFAILHRQCK